MLPRGYLFRVAGADPRRAQHLHKSTCDRTVAYGIAIHLPVVLWLTSALLLGREVFSFDWPGASALAIACGALIYLVERLVIAAPRSSLVNSARLVLGCIIAVLGASIVDLVLFEKEIGLALEKERLLQIDKRFDPEIESLRVEVTKKEAVWMDALKGAECEANGTCGSFRRGRGPIVDLLEKIAEGHWKTLLVSREKLQAEEQGKAAAIASARSDALLRSGILSRFDAFHRYALEKPLVEVAWGLFFSLVLAMELMVVFVKMVFPRTADDELEEVQEYIAAKRAAQYRDAMTSPERAVADLVNATYA